MISTFNPRQVERQAIRRWAGQALALLGRGFVPWFLLVTGGCVLVYLYTQLGLVGAGCGGCPTGREPGLMLAAIAHLHHHVLGLFWAFAAAHAWDALSYAALFLPLLTFDSGRTYDEIPINRL